MDNFGCFYNPRPSPGRCIKDIRSSIIESKCEIADNQCILKRDDETVKKLLVPTSLTLDKIKKRTNQEPDKIYIDKLIGPFSISMFKFNGDTFILIGETHNVTPETAIGSCPDGKERLDISLTNDKILYTGTSKNSMDIVRYLYQITQSGESRKNKMLDIFIEASYRISGGKNISPVSRGNLKRLDDIFKHCLFDDKEKCNLKYSRIHYFDFRGIAGKTKQYTTFGKLLEIYYIKDLRYGFINDSIHLLFNIATEIYNSKLKEDYEKIIILSQIWDILKMILIDTKFINRWLNLIIYEDDKYEALRKMYPSELVNKIEEKINEILPSLQKQYGVDSYIGNKLQHLMNSIRFFRENPKHVSHMYKAQKQLDRLMKENPRLGLTIYDYYKLNPHQMDVVDFSWFDHIDSMFEIQNILKLNNEKMVIKEQYNKDIRKIMDIFSLSRLLRKFGETEGGVKIVYMGDGHVGDWLKFFQETGLVSRKNITKLFSNPNKCLTLTGEIKEVINKLI